MYKLQEHLFFHILFWKKQSHCIDQHRLTAHLNLPRTQNRSNYQCVFLALQRSMQCHLQCISTFGNVASNLFQPMKWICWFMSPHGTCVRYKEKLLFKTEGVFEVNVVDQNSPIIILFQKVFFCCWYKLIFTSLAIGPSGLGTEDIKSKIQTALLSVQLILYYSDIDIWKASGDSDPESSSFSPITTGGA